jgi:hypothetical protein
MKCKVTDQTVLYAVMRIGSRVVMSRDSLTQRLFTITERAATSIPTSLSFGSFIATSSLVIRAGPVLQDTGSAPGWPWCLFGLIGARGAMTQALLQPQRTAG